MANTMNFFSLVIYVPLQLIFIPLAFAGIILTVYKQLIVSKRLGASQTAIEVLNGRWTMHVFGIQNDMTTEKLVRVLPNTSPTGLWLVMFPLWVKFKISKTYFIYPKLPKAGKETIADLIVARTIYFDRIIDRLVDDAEQFVVLGAGYDTRAYGPLKQHTLTFFELDQAKTQTMKINSLQEAGIDASHVRFVAVDFTQDSVFEKLKESGYDPQKRTVFLWEGVTLYLSESDVRKMLGEIRENSVSGSSILTDYYAERFIQIGSTKVGKKTLELTGEGLDFGLPLNSNHANVFDRFIKSENLGVGETHFLGSTNKKGPFAIVSETKI